MAIRPADSLLLLLLGTTLTIGSVAGCQQLSDEIGVLRQPLTPTERRVRSELIRGAAADAGVSNSLMLAGIADAETGLAHCWSEATWACQGPDSPSCDGGPVIAGAADGPCSAEQGGLGMFQFDGGTYEQTLARDGERVLTVQGNVEAAVDFVVAMLMRSSYVDVEIDSTEQALDWLNGIRVDDARYPLWIQTVTAHYNGCVPGRCSAYEARYANYDEATRSILSEFGEAFWYDDVVLPTCEVVPATGRIVEESDRCFTRTGTPSYWHEESAGHGEGLLWTIATADAPDNTGTWRLLFDASGEYELEVYTDEGFAESHRATYRVQHATNTESVTIDQSAADGFQSLGIFGFEAGTEAFVTLADNTGEPVGDDLKLVFDALRVTARGGPVDDGGTDDGGVTDGGGGCAIAHERSRRHALLWLLLLGLARVRFSRSSRAGG
jgi:hypothetical protein